MTDFTASSLIFIISQPRSGSTVLQRILGGHPQIHTLSEPWIMLPALGGLHGPPSTDAGDKWLWTGVRSFVDELPNREADYFEGVRRMACFLYEQALKPTGRRFFLDKTPRYYGIIPELARVFPQAHFLILLRQPLAVLASLALKRGRLDRDLTPWRRDLLDAPRLLLDGTALLGAQGLSVHYESLVRDPEAEVRRICDWLGIDFQPAMIEYGASGEQPRWRLGDKSGIDQQTRPVDTSVDKWTAGLAEPQFWRVAQDYLRLLGPETVEAMGYSSRELQQTLDRCRPPALALWSTIPLETLLTPPERRSAFRRTQIAARRIARRISSPKH